MPSFVQLESTAPVIWIRYSGEVSLQERLDTMRKAVARALESNCLRILVDYRSAHSLEHDVRAAEEIARYVAPRLGDRELRVAWLVTFDYQLNSALEHAIRELGIITARFRNRDKAMAWLQDPQAGSLPPLPPHTTAAATPTAEMDPTATAGDAAARNDAVAIVCRAADPQTRLMPAQYAAVVRMVDDLLATGMDEERIRPVARRMLQAMDPNPG